MLNISCNLLISVLKVKNWMSIHVENSWKVTSSLLSWLQSWLGAAVAATAQHHKGVSYRVSLAREKEEKSKFWSTVSTEWVSLSSHCKVETLWSWTIQSWDVCIDIPQAKRRDCFTTQTLPCPRPSEFASQLPCCCHKLMNCGNSRISWK